MSKALSLLSEQRAKKVNVSQYLLHELKKSDLAQKRHYPFQLKYI